MPLIVQTAKDKLDMIIRKSRVDWYKPIQIAEVLYHARLNPRINTSLLEDFQNPSIHWRDDITLRFTGKRSTSSARYQHDVWNETAMPPLLLNVLDRENKRLNGLVEKYIYEQYFSCQLNVGTVIAYVENTPAKDFDLGILLSLFSSIPGLRRSVDKVYEIVSYSLFETVVVALDATIKLEVPNTKKALLDEFPDLAKVILGVDKSNLVLEKSAHIYRVGVTNAADRGLDMWANFGIAIQVKHISLDDKVAKKIVDQVESDNIVIVCKDSDARTIQTITSQIGWGKRVRGLVKESDLIRWYEKCLRGSFANELSNQLLSQLAASFRKEFPQNDLLLQESFFDERGYKDILEDEDWMVNK